MAFRPLRVLRRRLGAAPAWALLLAGWLVGATGRALRGPPPPPPPVPVCTMEEDPIPAPPLSPREWRAAAGIGRKRSLTLARALWAEGVLDPLGYDPTHLPGIGPATAERITEFLASRGSTGPAVHCPGRWPPLPPLPPSPPPP